MQAYILRRRCNPASLRSWANLRLVTTPVGRRHYMNSNADVVKEGDAIFLKPRRLNAKPKEFIYLQRVDADGVTHNEKGTILHNNIIGRRVRDVVQNHRGERYLISFPTMEDYIVNSARIVTPIYPADAATIVQSLDLHVSSEVDPVNGPLEILEAGTGHGSLTLHLARAIFAGYAGKDQPAAILHSVEQNPSYHLSARHMFSKFRRGHYVGSGVKFYLDNVEDWLRKELKTRNQARQTSHDPTPDAPAAPEGKANAEHGDKLDHDTNISSADETGSSAPKAQASSKDLPFLSACVLDLPDPRPMLPTIMRAMRLEAILGYWAPSITQIVSVVEYIRVQKLPFFVDKVLEFSNGAGVSGARLWDVRVAKVRSRERAREAASPTSKAPLSNFHERFLLSEKEASGSDPSKHPFYEKLLSPKADDDTKEDLSDFEVVCRPKVGERTQGGGFFLVLRRVGHHRENPLEETGSNDQPPSERSNFPDLEEHDRRMLEGMSSGKNIFPRSTRSSSPNPARDWLEGPDDEALKVLKNAGIKSRYRDFLSGEDFVRRLQESAAQRELREGRRAGAARKEDHFVRDWLAGRDQSKLGDEPVRHEETWEADEPDILEDEDLARTNGSGKPFTSQR